MAVIFKVFSALPNSPYFCTCLATDARKYCKSSSPKRDTRKFLIILQFFYVFFAAQNCFASKQVVSEVNYFASLRASETNIRSGPGSNYPIKHSYHLRSMPVKVISEYDNWNEIEDFEGDTGWVSQSLLGKKRSLMVITKKKFVPLFSKNDEKSRVILHLENFVVGQYQGCVDDWCNMKVEGKKGWIKRSEVFGSDLQNEDEEDQQNSDSEEKETDNKTIKD